MTRMLLTAAWVLAAGVAPAADFVTIEDKAVSGTLQAVDAKGVMQVKLEKGAVVALPADEMMSITFGKDRDLEELLDGVVLYLPDGDRVAGALVKGSQTELTVKSAALGEVTLPIDKLLALEFRRAGGQPKNVVKLRAQLLKNASKNDVAFLINGDQMPGILVGFGTDRIKLKAALGELSLKHSRLFGLSFAARKRRPPPPSLLALARCVDGTTVTGQLMASKGEVVGLRLLAGPTVEIDAGQIIDMGFKQGKLVYLSDLKPAKAVTKPFFGGDHTWPHCADKSYDRKPIRLAGKTWRKGLGTFSGMTLSYTLGKGFSKFGALVGIDDADVNRQGNVTVRVLADGRELFKKEKLTRVGGPVKVDLSVKGVETLTLKVEFGENMHFGDMADWANAHLIR
jgi:NPCBM/NEW2 domain-containing protein